MGEKSASLFPRIIFLRIIRTVLPFCFALCCVTPRAGAALATLTSARAIRELSAVEAAKEYPVQLRAVITYVQYPGNVLFVQDATAGIFVFSAHLKFDAPLHTGEMIDISGRSAPGEFCSSIAEAAIHVIGQASLPLPIPFRLETVLSGEYDSQWGQLEGVVRSGKLENKRLVLKVATTGGTFLAVLAEKPARWEKTYIDARVQLRGVIGTIFNERRQAVGVRLLVPHPEQVRVLDPAPADPFAIPLSRAAEVGEFRPGADRNRRTRVRAAVTAVESPTVFFISDGTGTLAVQADPPCEAPAGSVLDIAGFHDLVHGRPGLRDSVCRPINENLSIKPRRATAAEVLPVGVQDSALGAGSQDGSRYDLQLVTMEGSLLQVSRFPSSCNLALTTPERDFTATVPESAIASCAHLKVGARLQLTGVVMIVHDDYQRARSFRLLVRTPADIVVLSRPPFWNIQHALWATFLMFLVVLASLAWNFVLRHQVSGKTHELRVANQNLLRIAVEDALTGAANRRRFDELLDLEVARAQRSAAPLSLVMIDIDFFKALNDRYGHQTGDQRLIQVVRALQGSVSRVTDVIARYGGEEFAAILPETPGHAAFALAESMRLSVFDLNIPHAGSPLHHRLSISLGVCTLAAGRTALPRELVFAADCALYQAKQRGRNRVVAYDETLESLVPRPASAFTSSAHRETPA